MSDELKDVQRIGPPVLLVDGTNAGGAIRKDVKPPKSILDPTFKYVNAANTDLAKTFARARWENERRKREAASNVEVIELAHDNVTELRKVTTP